MFWPLGLFPVEQDGQDKADVPLRVASRPFEQ